MFQGMSRDLFSPPLSQQRSHYLAGIAFGSAVDQLVDLGCGDGALLQVLKAQVIRAEGPVTQGLATSASARSRPEWWTWFAQMALCCRFSKHG